MALNSLWSITLSVLFLSVFTYLQGQYFWDIQIHLESETCNTYPVSSVSSLFFFYQCSPTCTEAFCHIMGNFHTSVLRGKLTLCWKITLKANLQSYQQQNNNNKTHTHLGPPPSVSLLSLITMIPSTPEIQGLDYFWSWNLDGWDARDIGHIQLQYQLIFFQHDLVKHVFNM